MIITDFLPKKVLRIAAKWGVHADCIAAGSDKCCIECQDDINMIMDHFYGDLSPDDAAIAIIGDLLEDATHVRFV